MPRQIFITGLNDMPRRVRELAPTHLISVIQPELQPRRPVEIEPEHHLQIAVHDISEPDRWGVLPEATDVVSLIDFVHAWDPDAGSVLIHCYAGVSRSTAAALIAHCLKTGDPEISARRLRESAPHAAPNRRIVALADEALALGGALVRASESIGPPSVHLEDEVLATISL